MCKIAMMSGIKPKYVKNAWALAKVLAPYMSVSDDDGFGYAAITKKGDIFIERWLDNDMAFRFKEGNKYDKEINAQLGAALVPLESNYTSVGKVERNEAVAIMLHARMATCAKGIKNVHPFKVDDVAIIHNGVISNHAQVLGKYDANNTRLSTCDSESIAFSYSANKVGLTPDAIKQLGDDMTGYYACGVLTKDTKGHPIMDVFKSSSANLYGAFIPQIDAFLYSTSLDILKDAVKECGFSYMRPHKVKEGNLIRHDAVTGKASVVANFSERGYGYSSYPSSYYGEDWMNYAPSKHHGAGTIVDATTTKHTTYESWEAYQEAKYGSPSKEPTYRDVKKEETANDLIVKEVRQLPGKSTDPVPAFILAIQDMNMRNEAVDDFMEVQDRYNDFRTDTLNTRMKA